MDNFLFEKYCDILKPKPVFNTKYYNASYQYSEGEDIENLMVQLTAENPPEKYGEAICENLCWNTFYHLSHVRRNILNWYPFKKGSKVLEIGCGFGAITGLLCEKCESVTAVELSYRRAMGAYYRCRDFSNLEIIVGNLNDIDFSEKYDYITLIGVLEYQGSYTDGSSPFMDFLKKIKVLLKPEGTLLIAIENQYGLKYWCGAREDHTGIPFDGINNYNPSGSKNRTFSREGLKELVHNSGFKNTFFYYPMPDYKLPSVIYSEEYLPNNGNMHNCSFYYAPNSSSLVAEEAQLYDDIIKNGTFEFFANSFLVECRDSLEDERVVFAKLNETRNAEHQVGTRILDNGTVEKFTMQPDAVSQLETILDNEENLKKRGINVQKSVPSEGKLITSVITEVSLEDEVLNSAMSNDLKSVFQLTDMLYDEIKRSSELADAEDNLILKMFPDNAADKHKYGIILREASIDMIMRNAFVVNGSLVWIDQEWCMQNLPAGYVMYRAIKELYISFPQIRNNISDWCFCNRYGITDCIPEYEALERAFFGVVVDQHYMYASSRIFGSNRDAIRNNISSLNK